MTSRPKTPRPVEIRSTTDASLSVHSLGNSLKVSAYDRAASMLIALLIVVGLAVTLLFLIWLTSRVLTRNEEVVVQFLEPRGAEGQMGEEKGFEEPELEEVEELIEPELEETVETIAQTVSNQLASLETFRSSSAGGGGNRDSGPGGQGDADVIPRWQRWEIRYSSKDLKTYARQLESFGIELAATGGGKNIIEYATDLAARRPQRRTGPADGEDRLYMLWRSGPLRQADRELLSLAGIATEGKVLVQFYPPEVEQTLGRLEREKAGNRDVTDIRRTVFGVQGSGDNYEFYVISQEFRSGR